MEQEELASFAPSRFACRARPNDVWTTLRLPGAPTCLGNPDSYPRHVAAARATGLRLATIDRDGLAFDLDGPADLADLTAVAEARVGGQGADASRSGRRGGVVIQER